MTKFRTNYNYKRQHTAEKFSQPSQTQPDHTYKIRDIIKRAERGQFVPVLEGNYDEEGRLSIIRRPNFDLTDIDTIQWNIQEMRRITDELKEAESKKKEEAEKSVDQETQQQVKPDEQD